MTINHTPRDYQPVLNLLRTPTLESCTEDSGAKLSNVIVSGSIQLKHQIYEILSRYGLQVPVADTIEL